MYETLNIRIFCTTNAPFQYTPQVCAHVKNSFIKLGELIISLFFFTLLNLFRCRCNNVLYIRGVEEEDEEGEMKE